MPSFLDITGEKYGRLTVISRAGNIGRRTAWVCNCDCGNPHIARGNSLRTGEVKSCGCIQQAAPEAARKAKAAEATRRWRARHPDRNKASQVKADSSAKRRLAQRKRAAAKRETEAWRQWWKAYRNRPDVKARERERRHAKKQERLEKQRIARRSPEWKASRAAAMRAIRATATGKLNNRMAVCVRRGLSEGKKGRTWHSLVGYTAAELRTHIERQFTKGMSWENANEWHIDHIIPLSSFRFSSASDPEFRAAWALTNLRPLWAKENVLKGARRIVLL